MEQAMMMVMQLCEEFSSRRGHGQTLTEDEVLAYNASLNTIKTFMRFAEKNYANALEAMENSEPPEEGG